MPGSECMPPSNFSEPLRLDSDLHDIEMQSRDVFILADVSHPSQLENYSTGIQLPKQEVFGWPDPSPSSPDAPVVTGKFGLRVLMGKVKLEEAGTTWSQPERPTATSPMRSGVSFRASTAANEQERPWTYKLHWQAGPIERPPTYKLQWFTDQDVEPAAKPYELRWRK